MISVNQFLDLSKNAKVQWQKARDEFQKVRQSLATVRTVSERTSEHSDISGNVTSRRRDDGDDAYKGTLKQGFTVNFTQEEIALQVDVTKQMRKFDKYDEIMKRMRQMGRGTERRMEMDVAAFLSYAWASSYVNIDGETVATTTPDGNALIDTTHDANGSSNTFSNEISTTHSPISTDVLEALEEKGNGFIDEADGRLIPVQFNSIISSRHAPTVHTIRRIINPLNNQLQGTTDNDRSDFINYKHVIVPFLDFNHATEARDTTKSKYVFVANLGSEDDSGILMEMSQDIQFETPEQVFANSVWEFMTTGMYDIGLLRANWVAATKGDSTSV